MDVAVPSSLKECLARLSTCHWPRHPVRDHSWKSISWWTYFVMVVELTVAELEAKNHSNHQQATKEGNQQSQTAGQSTATIPS